MQGDTETVKISHMKLQSGRAAEEFLQQGHSLKSVQERILTDTLAANANCTYGKHYGFDKISGISDYRRIPLIDYQRLDKEFPGIWNKVSDLSGDRLLAYFLTSGSTAEPKKIPVTTGLVREKARAFSVFWDSIYTAHPALVNGNFISNFADSGKTERDENGIQLLSETTFWNQRMQGFQKPDRWPAGKHLAKIESAELRYYAAARLALQAPLHCMMSLNPSTLVKLCQVIEQRSGDLIRGLNNGTWGLPPADLDGVIPDVVSDRLKVDKQAAARLENETIQGQSHFQLKKIWPELELIICWQSKIVEPYLRQLDAYSSGIDRRDYITQSSECMMAIPLEDNSSGGLLAFTSHFFEFIRENETECEQPETVLAWELEEGSRYEVVVTTGGGLYRYRTGDCVTVDGFVGQIPRINFQYRLGTTSSMTGEKLTEMHILAALAAANNASICELSDVLVFPRTGDQPHYAVMVPASAATAGEKGDRALESWVACFDEELCKANREYEDKRNSLRLGEPRLLRVSDSDYQQLQAGFRAAHVGDDQYKPGLLRKERDLDEGIAILEEICAHH